MRYGQEAKSLALAMDQRHSILADHRMEAMTNLFGRPVYLDRCQGMVKGLDLNIQTGEVRSFAHTSAQHVRR